MATATQVRKSAFDQLYPTRVGEPEVVDVPSARFLTVDGEGSPDTRQFKDAISALYSLAYTAKFQLKHAGGPIVKVPPLEGLYEVPGVPAGAFTTAARARLRWRLMLRLPDEVGEPLLKTSRLEAARKKVLPSLGLVRVTTFDEGRCVQVLHRGPYATENETIASLHRFIERTGLRPRGRHHEIYMSVPGLTRPENLKTIIRQPVA